MLAGNRHCNLHNILYKAPFCNAKDELLCFLEADKGTRLQSDKQGFWLSLGKCCKDNDLKLELLKRQPVIEVSYDSGFWLVRILFYCELSLDCLLEQIEM